MISEFRKFIQATIIPLFATRAFLVYALVGLLVRFWNYRRTLYFIWDQGRDAWALQNMAAGDLRLTGPTSGLEGFFLGPLWYYVGLPGYWLSQGNPYGIGLWYIFLACLALPIFWAIAHTLFSEKKMALTTAWFLSLLPGSIQGSIFIWNPLLSLPLMAAAFLCLLWARQSRWALWGSFFFLGLTLQSEFAYAVFFLVPLFFLIPWIRQRSHWLDWLGASFSLGVTLLPQLLFELKNNFTMTRALLNGVANTEESIHWLDLWLQRPLQLLYATKVLWFGNFASDWIFFLLVVVGISLGIWSTRFMKDQLIRYRWRITAILTIIPYVFFMFWRGNHGHFFEYYLTPHFIFLVPLFLLAWQHVGKIRRQFFGLVNGQELVVLTLGFFIFVFTYSLYTQIFFVQNQGGLRGMERSLAQLFSWQFTDDLEQSTWRIYTPNGQTEHYDYLLHWMAQTRGYKVPSTVRQPGDHTWYLLLEKDEKYDDRFLPWYSEATKGGVLVRRERHNAHILETWMKSERADERGLPKLLFFPPEFESVRVPKPAS